MLARLRRTGRRTARALWVPPRELLTTLRAFAVIVVVELLIRWMPLPRLSRLLGVRLDLRPRPVGAAVMACGDLPAGALRQLRCTWRVADAWPFSKGPCLRRALVGGHMLRALDPAVRIGLAPEGDRLVGHAWLEIDDHPLERIDGVLVFERASA
jgi:hypothetical protein